MVTTVCQQAGTTTVKIKYGIREQVVGLIPKNLMPSTLMKIGTKVLKGMFVMD
jgi:hypothetical protein